jgi:hypothetical protein
MMNVLYWHEVSASAASLSDVTLYPIIKYLS